VGARNALVPTGGQTLLTHSLTVNLYCEFPILFIFTIVLIVIKMLAMLEQLRLSVVPLTTEHHLLLVTPRVEIQLRYFIWFYNNPVYDATACNNLPLHVASSPSLVVFGQRLETFLFSRSYRDTVVWLVCYYYHSSLLSGCLWSFQSLPLFRPREKCGNNLDKISGGWAYPVQISSATPDPLLSDGRACLHCYPFKYHKKKQKNLQ